MNFPSVIPAETTSRRTEHGRWYDDACGAAFAMEVLGERWALLIVRELLLGPLRFSHLRAALPRISARVLTERLDNLIAHGVIERRALHEGGTAQFYALTAWGHAAEPAILALCRWGVSARAHDPFLPLSPVAAALSLKANYAPPAPASVPLTIGLAIGDTRLLAQLGPAMTVARGDLAPAEAVLTAATALPILAAFYRKTPIGALEADGTLRVSGDRAVAEEAQRRFAFPDRLTG